MNPDEKKLYDYRLSAVELGLKNEGRLRELWHEEVNRNFRSVFKRLDRQDKILYAIGGGLAVLQFVVPLLKHA